MKSQKLEKTLKHFYQISGMEIVLMDANFRNIVSFRCPGENLCSLIHRSPHCLDICKASDLEHFGAARVTEKEDVYECPFGITEALIPIKRNGKTVSHLFCSSGVVVRTGNEDEEIAERISKVAPTLPYDEVITAVRSTQHITPEEYEAYHTMLTLLGEHIENNDMSLDAQPTIGGLTKRYISNNLARKITLADLSWNLHCSTVTLTEHFKEEFGITIMEYVTRKRMELAERLLASTDKSIKEIALLSGFPDVEYFSRCFRKFHGVPPGEWRKNL